MMGNGGDNGEMERVMIELSLDGGEKGWKVDLGGSQRAVKDDLCMIHDFPSGLVLEVMARQFGNFIGTFLDNYMKTMGTAYRGFMRIGVRIDDLSIKAAPRKAKIGKICWLRDEGVVFKMNEVWQSSYSGSVVSLKDIQGFFQKSTLSSQMEKVHRRLGFSCGIEVSSDGSRGGLALCWKEACKIRLRSYFSGYMMYWWKRILKAINVGLQGFMAKRVRGLSKMSVCRLQDRLRALVDVAPKDDFFEEMTSRNKITYEGVYESVRSLLIFVLGYLRDLDSLPSGSENITAIESLLWRPPVDPWVCVNFYDGFFDNYKVSNTRVAVKNSERLLMGLAYFEQEHVPCLLRTEALACMRALEFARDLGFRCVELEGDSVMLISKLNSYDIDRSKVRTIV
ncbi:hypothetical protein Godav_024864 [Gossypium davidsonii]|uniref:RNase H type-1 domain-containing protein n=1 Tax=Gossypium davidsonii TaxID=34287 RepID=A0A7J8TDC3_GOSDV|nr:hypothetical protein [Gossypium davidsonii]